MSIFGHYWNQQQTVTQKSFHPEFLIQIYLQPDQSLTLTLPPDRRFPRATTPNWSQTAAPPKWAGRLPWARPFTSHSRGAPAPTLPVSTPNGESKRISARDVRGSSSPSSSCCSQSSSYRRSFTPQVSFPISPKARVFILGARRSFLILRKPASCIFRAETPDQTFLRTTVLSGAFLCVH